MITGIETATAEKWDALADACDSALYFQTREWFEIWEEYAGFRSDPKLIRFAGGSEALLPLARRPLLGGALQATFLAPKGMGGFLTSTPLTEQERGELFGVLGRQPMHCLVMNPYDELSSGFGPVTSVDVTQVLELSQGFDNIFRNWAMGHYTRTKKGLRQGIVVEPAATEEQWRAYFRIYQDNLARWGDTATNNYSWQLFQSMYRRNSPKIRLWLASYQGELVSGALCFYHNRHVAYWHSATAQQFYKKLNATHVLQYHIIKDACDRGYLLYDMLPSSGIEGVIEFKRGFSPAERPVHVCMSPLMQLMNNARNRLRHSRLYRSVMKSTGF